MAKKKKGNKRGYHSPQKHSNQPEKLKFTNGARTRSDTLSPKRNGSSWKQDNAKITFVVELLRKPSHVNDVDTRITDNTVNVALKGSIPWKCTLFGEVIKNSATVSLQGPRVIISVSKKEQGVRWAQLEKPDEREEPEQEKPNCETVENVEEEKSVNEEKEAEVVEEKERGKKADDSGVGLSDSSDQNEETESVEESVFELDHIKHDWYEKNASLMSVPVYVKNASSIKVAFQEKSVNVKFKTKDPKFLSMHEGTDENTTFSWFINVFAELNTEACKFKVTQLCIELTLNKKEPKKWSTLEARLKQPSSGKPVTATWTSTAKSDSDLKNVKLKSEENNIRSKIIFDEMQDGKEKEDEPEKESVEKGGDGDSTDFSAQKPTCMVSPLKESGEQVVRPGMTGLENLGNTCFMNSVLQVLANTTELRDYFIEATYQKDINSDNPLGTGGKLAVSFALLLKVLWSGKQYSFAPSKLKNLVAQKASQFSGYAQHDAQEFMAFLLDGLHEDLNRIKKKPYTQTVDSDGRLDEVVADEAWSVHRKRNDSFIVDHFQGQYKSKLTCPVCGKVSITFDPFMILPVPLPKKQRLLPIIFMSKDPHRKPVKYMLRLPKDATFDMLKKAVSELTGVHPKDLRIFETYKHSIHQFFTKGSTSISGVNPTDVIIVSEVLSEKVAGEKVYEVAVSQRGLLPQQIPSRCSYCRHECPPDSMLKRCTRCYRTAYCDKKCQANDWHSRHRTQCKMVPEALAEPFLLSIPASQATYSRLVQMLEAFSRHSIDVFQPPVAETNTEPTSENQQNPNYQPDADNATSDASEQDNPSPAPSATFSEDTLSTNENSLSSTQSESSTTDLEDRSSQDASTEKSEGNEADKSDDSSSPKVPTRYVMGRQRDLVFVEPPFQLKPLERNGRGSSEADGKRLQDQGEEPLDLTNITFLTMDWKNREKCKPYVMVQSKPLEYEEHESMRTMSLEEQREIGLEHCFDLFTEPEVLNPEESWYCPKCKEHREATKQLSIWRLPSTLVIQLKRFSFRNFIWRDKIDKMVNFPTRSLDMDRFYVGNRPANEPPPIYDLYGVINHYGGILGGHYTSYARTPDTLGGIDEQGWRLFDDAHVSSTSEKQVVTKSAYVLFYRRRDYQAHIPLHLNAAKKCKEAEDLSEEEEAENKHEMQNDTDEIEDSEVSLVPNVDLLATPSQGSLKQRSSSSSKPSSTVTASEAQQQQAWRQSHEALEEGNAIGGGCASALSSILGHIAADQVNLDEGLDMDSNIDNGILPLNVDTKVTNSDASSEVTDMDTVD